METNLCMFSLLFAYIYIFFAYLIIRREQGRRGRDLIYKITIFY